MKDPICTETIEMPNAGVSVSHAIFIKSDHGHHSGVSRGSRYTAHMLCYFTAVQIRFGEVKMLYL